MLESNAQLDHLSRELLAQLQRILPAEAFRTEFTDRLVVTIPARAAQVGDITIWLDGDEVTVGIGELHHCHFEVYTQSADALEEREHLAAESAVDYIRDIIEERVRFRIQFEGGRCIGSSGWYPEHCDAGPPIIPHRRDQRVCLVTPTQVTQRRRTMRCSELLRASRWLLPASTFPPPRSQRAALRSR